MLADPVPWVTHNPWDWLVLSLDITHMYIYSSSVVSNSLWPYGRQPSRLFSAWNFPGKNTGMGCHFLLQGNLWDPGIKPKSLVSTVLAGGLFITAPPGKPLWAYWLLVNSSRYEAGLHFSANPEHAFPTAMSYVSWNSVLLPRGMLPGTTDSKELPSCLTASEENNSPCLFNPSPLWQPWLHRAHLWFMWMSLELPEVCSHNSTFVNSHLECPWNS